MRKWLVIGVCVAVLAALIAWRIHGKVADVAAQERVRDMRRNAPAVVSVAVAARHDVVHTFDSIGSVEAPYNVKLAPKVAGRIEFLQVREGDPVTEGQVLARIDPSEVRAQVSQQQAQVAEARSRLAQAQLTQGSTNVAVSSQVQQQLAALSTAEALYDQAHSNYSAQLAAAQADVTDAQGRLSAAEAAVGNGQAAVRSAQANLENARARYTRAAGLFKQGYIAAQDVDDARTAVSVQEAAVEVANGQLASARAQVGSATAQKRSAEEQASIAKTKGATDIAAARAQVRQARATLATARANTSQGPAYAQNLAALRASVDAAEAQLRNAQAQLANTVITSPITGSVTERNADPGALASPSQPILAVQAIRQVYVNVPVPEDVSRQVFAGQLASVRLDGIPGRVFQAKVSRINPAADPTSRQFTVRLILDNPQGTVKPGMFARVSIVTERTRGALVVPREAVQQGPDGSMVTVVSSDDTAQSRPVTLGTSDANRVAVTAGLRPGEKVVTLSAAPLRDGQKVRVGGEGRGRPGAGAGDGGHRKQEG